MEGDRLHPPANVEKMRRGSPLTDADRAPWLDRIGRELKSWAAEGRSGVMTCSALKRAYRDRIRAARPDVRFVYLKGSEALIGARVAARHHEYMPASLLRSQFDTLEEPDPDEPGVVSIDAGGSPDEEVAAIIATLGSRAGSGRKGRVARRAGGTISPADPSRNAPMPSPKKPQVKRVVLAYSGGLDTSIILKWLQTEYRAEVITFTADLGQGEELEPARKKAELLGVKPQNIFIEDLREEFVRDYVFPMFRANALYEGQYLLGTSIARPLIAKRLVEIAQKMGADAIAHGATGKGNDQVRFELSAYALDPDIRIIAPWREWDFASRTQLLAFAEQHQIPIAKDKRGEAPFSVDANLLHCSSEGKVLEDPAEETPHYVYSRTIHPEDAPDKPTVIEIAFEKGDPVATDGKRMSPATLLAALNKLGHDNGIGRLDLVENRFVGMKSRGMYETPGGTILLAAHRAIESITLDRGAAHLKDELMPKYAELIYNGFWFSPERELLQVLIDKSQEMVAGRVRLKLYKGGVHVIGRDSPHSLYDQDLVTFEEGAVAYDHNDASGFIKLNALRLRTLAKRRKKAAKG